MGAAEKDSITCADIEQALQIVVRIEKFTAELWTANSRL